MRIMKKKARTLKQKKLYDAEHKEFYRHIYRLGFNEAERQYMIAMANLRKVHQLEIDTLTNTLLNYMAAFRESANEIARLDANNPLAYLKITIEETKLIINSLRQGKLRTRLKKELKEAEKIEFGFKE